MKKIDVLGMYEHTVRELDSLIILKNYLSLMGKKMEICDVVFTRRWKSLSLYPKVLLIPFLYSAIDTKYTSLPFKKIYGNFPIIVNMHWEQLGSINSQYFLAPKDKITRDVFHVSWSRDFTEFLVDEGKVNRELIWETGNPKADLLTHTFIDTYSTKKEMAEIFGIPFSAKIIVFIMSFSAAFIDEKYIKSIEIKGGYKNIRKMVQISKESLYKSLEVLKEFAAMISKKNIYLIIRPHPMEPINEIKKYVLNSKNIRVSREFPLHEVLYNSDGVISWLSTGTLDAFLFKKPVAILRPIKIPQEFDIPLLQGFPIATTASQLWKILSEDSSSRINNNLLEGYLGKIYGKLDGKNTLRLSKRINSLFDHSENNNLYVRLSLYEWTKVLGQFITKDITKLVLAKLFPNILPIRIKGRLDDIFTQRKANYLSRKYASIVKEMYNNSH